LKKLTTVAAILALVLAVAVPAIAQVSQGFGNQGQSGNVSPSFTVTDSSSNASQSVSPLQFGNTGNVSNSQGFLQYASGSGNLEAEGPTITFAPQLNASSNQPVQQSSGANGSGQ
jgi:hypothetical protein